MPKTINRLASITYLEFLKKFFGETYLISLPAIAATLEAERTQVQLALPIFFLSMLVAQLFAGPVSDFFGRQKVILTLIPFFIIGNMISALLNDIPFLYFGIILIGLGIGAAPTLGKAILYDIAKHTKKAVILLVLTSYIVVWSPAIGMAIGGNLAHYFSWRWVFIVNIFLGVFAFVISAVYLKGNHFTKHHQTFQYYLSQYLYCLKSRKLIFLLLTTGSLTSGIIVYYTITAFLYHTTLGLPLNVIGYLAFFIVLSNIFGKTITLFLIHRLSIATLIITAVITSLIASSLMLLFTLFSKHDVLFILLPMMLYTVGIGILMPAIRVNILSLGKKHVGGISSVTSIAISLFAAISSTIAAHMDIGTAMPLAIILLCLAVFAMFCVLMAARSD